MANIETGSGNRKGGVRKVDLRVDFTPMVDMNMLLLTFFMFTTSLSKPQIMNLVLPVKDDVNMTLDEKSKVKDSKAITLILGANDKVYYYFGQITPEMYDNPKSLQETDYAGLREVLLDRNMIAMNEIRVLTQQKHAKEITEEEFNARVAEIKKDPEGQVVMIKPTDHSTYENMIDALDEMQITNIGIYNLLEMTEGDTFLLYNFLTNGGFAATGQIPVFQ